MTKEPKKNKRGSLWIFFAVVVFCALLVTGYWMKWGRYSVHTTDAYVEGNIIEVSSRLSGAVRTMAVNDTACVVRGQVLATLDPTNYYLRFEKSKASLANTLRQVQQIFDQEKEIEAQLAVQEILNAQALLNYEHRKALVEIGGVAREEYEQSYTNLLAGQAEVTRLEESLNISKAQTYNVTILTHPLVLEAIDAVKLAWVDLCNTKIRAPADGFIAKKSAQVGETVDAGQPLLAIVPLNGLWVNANFKESKLASIRVGQRVEVKTDMYKGHAVFDGYVMGISPGTGSVFSLLPPQNATGNWIKIIQRVPVRIRLDPKELTQYPLRLGLSAKVSVDIRDLSGEILSKHEPAKPLYQTDIYDDQLKGVQEIIEQIIRQNLIGRDGNEIRN